jgi:hypothetical protein
MDDTIHDFRKAFRTMRRLFAVCRACGQASECTLRTQFSQQIDEIIQQINREWQDLQ